MSFRSSGVVVLTVIVVLLVSAIFVMADEAKIRNLKADVITSVPRSMTYQGILKDGDGEGIPDSFFDVTFRLFDAESDGTMLWSQVINIGTDANGMFTAELTNLNIPFNEDCWLELEIGSEILDPRQRLTMVGYSARSDTADYALATSGGGANGWVDDGAVVRLEIDTDSVGIGTSTPLEKLHVEGNLLVSDKATIGPGNTNTGNYTFVVGYNNTVSGDGCTVTGGVNNSANDMWNTVGGGYENTIAFGEASTIAGGYQNSAQNDGIAIGGGRYNSVSGNYSVIGGGQNNSVEREWSTIAGGTGNSVYGAWGFIGGGENNSAGDLSAIGGGSNNTAEGTASIGGGAGNSAIGEASTVAGGDNNQAVADGAFAGGGYSNITSGESSVLVGGLQNSVTGLRSAIGGGHKNLVGGNYSAILGGYADTIATGADYSYLFGINSNLTQDSTFMVDLPHIHFGDETTGYEFPNDDGTAGQVMATDGAGQLGWGSPGPSSGWVDNGGSVILSNINDNVGIGITNPGVKLVVVGDVYVTGKSMLGTGCSGTGLYAFAAGYNNHSNQYYSTIGGGAANTIDYISGHLYGTISGGQSNRIVTGTGGTIGGGTSNTIQGGGNWDYRTISGGHSNIVRGHGSTIGGGSSNDISVNSDYSTISGGQNNQVTNANGTIGGGYSNSTGQGASVLGGNSNNASSNYSSIGGGALNSATGIYTAIGGGEQNSASGSHSIIAGGLSNSTSGDFGTVSGGWNNNAGSYGVVAGGSYNSAGSRSFVGTGYADTASGILSCVVGGRDNIADGDTCFIGGGRYNQASGIHDFIGGGKANTADGDYVAICGGVSNSSLADYSTIVGGAGNSLGASATNSMVYGSSVYLNQAFRVGFFSSAYYGGLGVNRDSDDGGISWPIHVGTNSSNGNGAYLTPAGTWFSTSSKGKKENFLKFGRSELFDKISGLEVESWQYIDSRERHIGPYAEEFNTAFGTGAYDLDGNFHNDAVAGNDVAGVALAGVKELIQENLKLKQAIAELRSEIKALKGQNK